MDLNESGHSESKFYCPEEETLNQTTPINCDEVELDKHLHTTFKKKMSFNGLGWSVWEKTVSLVSRPWAAHCRYLESVNDTKQLFISLLQLCTCYFFIVMMDHILNTMKYCINDIWLSFRPWVTA